MKDFEAENRKFFFYRKLDFSLNVATFFYLIFFFYSLIFAFSLFVFLFKLLLIVSSVLFVYEAIQSYRFNKRYRERERLYSRH